MSCLNFFSFQEFDNPDAAERHEESCSCDLNSIDNTESDGSPALIKSRSETLETLQSSEAVSLDSRLSDKPETPTTARENNSDTPTILEENNSEPISLPTTQETSEVISIESSSDLYSDVHKIESSSPDSLMQETMKDSVSIVQEPQGEIDSVVEGAEDSPVVTHVDEEKNEPETAAKDEEVKIVEIVEAEVSTDEVKEPEEPEAKIDEATTKEVEQPKEEKEIDDTVEVDKKSEEKSEKEEITDDKVEVEAVVTAVDEIQEPVVAVEETEPKPETEDSNVKEEVKPDDLEAKVDSIVETPVTEEAEHPRKEDEEVKVSSESVESKESPIVVDEKEVEAQTNDEKEEETVSKEDEEKPDDENVGVKTDEDKKEVSEDVKSLICSTSVIESSDTCKDTLVVEGNEDSVETLDNSELSNGDRTVDSVVEDISAVVNGNDNDNDNDNGNENENEVATDKVDDEVNENKDSGEPSNVSISISDKTDIPVRTETVVDEEEEEVEDSISNNSDVQSSVGNVTENQVPNTKQQIPTISTVCDSTKNLPDGVPQQIVSTKTIATDDLLSNNLNTDHIEPRRRSSLPIVPSESINDAIDDAPSLPVPLRKMSSPQKRPRSASTSTQVDPNHFGG